MFDSRPLETAPVDALSPEESALWTGLVQAHGALARELDADLRAAHGLPLSDFEILLGLGAGSCERMRMAALADSVLLSPSGLSRAVERLQARGLVQRVPCTDDRRGAFAVLTAAGVDLAGAANATYAAGIRRRYLDRISQTEREVLAALWRRLAPPGAVSCECPPVALGETQASTARQIPSIVLERATWRLRRDHRRSGLAMSDAGMAGEEHTMSDVEETSTNDEFNNFNQNLIAEFRANGGKVGGMFAGAPLLLLTTTGAKSGQLRVAPLAYTTDNGHYVVIASKGGAPTNPDWFHNVRANPDVTIEVGTESFPARASIPEGDERDRLFDQMAAQMPGFAEYQRNTTRRIPVVVLEKTR
jgi:deazaflavin-dependent oxidoreductase (nitroreductase family)